MNKWEMPKIILKESQFSSITGRFLGKIKLKEIEL